MLMDEAKLLLGFPTNACPNASQVKAAYRKKVWETHPDCFPVHLKPNAELKFKMVNFPLCRRNKCLFSSFLMIPAVPFH
ncbi:hypothetical protein H5410_029645 [Solanum commersonii]|uniref:J domain-containing protein n=1 Tax=Solanum commersonii TaxID=4109 RepID=A0A9J5YC29_SOLCO|nr:hypothetical protein H5410_029645 [Solanum commersonii]